MLKQPIAEIPVYDLHMASTLATLGFAIRPENAHMISDSDKHRRIWFCGTRSVSDATMQATPIIAALQGGSMETKRPNHPAIVCNLAATNADHLVGLAANGGGYSQQWLKTIPLARVLKGRFERGQSTAGKVITTPDLPVAAGLATLGFRCLWTAPVPGMERRFKWTFDAIPMCCWHGEPIETDAISLLRRYRENTLQNENGEHPFLWATQTVHNQDNMRRTMDNWDDLIMLRKPKTWRTAFLRKSSSDKAKENAIRRLGL